MRRERSFHSKQYSFRRRTTRNLTFVMSTISLNFPIQQPHWHCSCGLGCQTMFYESDMSAPVCSVLCPVTRLGDGDHHTIIPTPNSTLCTCSLINRDANRARSSWYLENLWTIIYCLLSIHSFTFRHLKEYDFYRLLNSFQYSAYGQNRSLHNKLWGTCGNILGENYKIVKMRISMPS